ncbi:class II fructose-bisphosphate aldolase [Tessaracoccus lubricantis]
MLTAASKAAFAVPAVNILDNLSLRAVVAAAEETEAPVIIQVSVKTVRSFGVRLVTEMFREVATSSPAPLSLHLDHCPDVELIREVVDAGWQSVLFDASDRDLNQAEEETAQVVAYAHAAGVDVESEIENIIGVEDGVGSDEAIHSYGVGTLVEVANRTNADFIAPQLGTAHGSYKSKPQLLPDRVREFLKLTDRPIVLHGGTGLSPQDFSEFIHAGVSKINVSTALKESYMRSAKAHLDVASAKNEWEPTRLFADVLSGVRQEIVGFIHMFSAAGKADLVAEAVK